MSFEELGLSAPLVRAVGEAGYTIPTAVQDQAIPPVLAGRDLLGCSQTGTGKTAAFALPILHKLSETPVEGKRRRVTRSLILAPTRELAGQIGDCFLKYGRGSGLRVTVIFGGVSQFRQTRDLQRGVDIVVATPGRLLDLYQQGFVDLSKVEIAVLDEADHMLDMGFLPDVRRIMEKVPQKRQTLLFSATMPPAIRELTEQLLVDPVQIRIAPEQPAAELVEQGLYLVQKSDKLELLVHLLEARPAGSTLIFARTKHGADRIFEKLEKKGVSVQAIHGNKSQNARQRALDSFRSGETQVLVATDIAARGIDVRGIQYVINFDCPETPETYVHRIGRTGRAGDSGNAVSFCSGEERGLMQAVEKHLKTRLNVLQDGPASLILHEELRQSSQGSQRKSSRGGGSRRGGSSHGGSSSGGGPRMGRGAFGRNANRSPSSDRSAESRRPEGEFRRNRPEMDNAPRERGTSPVGPTEAPRSNDRPDSASPAASSTGRRPGSRSGFADRGRGAAQRGDNRRSGENRPAGPRSSGPRGDFKRRDDQRNSGPRGDSRPGEARPSGERKARPGFVKAAGAPAGRPAGPGSNRSDRPAHGRSGFGRSEGRPRKPAR